jgi:hypothetical protein
MLVKEYKYYVIRITVFIGAGSIDHRPQGLMLIGGLGDE